MDVDETMRKNITWNPVIQVRGDNKIPSEIIRSIMVQRAWSLGDVVYIRSVDGYGSIEEVIEVIENHGGDVCIDEVEDTEHTYMFVFDGIDAFLYLSGFDEYVTITIEGFQLDPIIELTEAIDDILDVEPPKGNIRMLASDHGNLFLTSLGEVDEPLIRENYSKDILDQYDRILADLRSDTPSGRLTVLDGAPGTGKSYFIRGLVSEAEALYVYVPASIGGELTGPNVIPVFLRERDKELPIVLIMEDADVTLTSRQLDNVGQLSDLLNMSDGIMGDMSDIRIIATTNASVTDIDTAVLRAGRISEHVTLKALDIQHSLKVLSRLLDKEIPDPLVGPFRDVSGWKTKDKTLANIYQLARENGWKPAPRKKNSRPRIEETEEDF